MPPTLGVCLATALERANSHAGSFENPGKWETPMSMQMKPGRNAVSKTQSTWGSTRRRFILTAAAAASSTLMHSGVSRAAIVQTDTAKLPPLPLPPGIRSRYVPNINGLTFHVLEAGFESSGRPCLLLLHGYPELAYAWRRVMPPLAAAGFHVIAPDMRGYGRTTGWDDSYDGDVFPFRHTNLVRDALGLVSAFGYRTAAVVGRDAGSPVAAYCAVMRPDVFRSVAMMTSPFAGPPALPFNTVDGGTQGPTSPPRASTLNDELAKLTRPRKHYQIYYTTREANDNMMKCSQGVHAFLRAYYHYKSADWKGNKPFRLASLTAEELAKMPTYYIMDLDKGMAETVAPVMPTAAEIAACKWLPDNELAVYTAEYERTGFQGGLQGYRRTGPRFVADLQTFGGRTIDVPSLFIGGKSDWGVFQNPGAFEAMQNRACTQMRGVHLIDGAGHWLEQEQSEQVSKLLIQFFQNAGAASGPGR
jgi:pimeloyl-ACP methyl ester carboxylesterase